MKKRNIIFNRELSWLSFNHRVLQEAGDDSVPLFERIKFLAIYSNNLDEFFRVRVASLRSLLVLKNPAKEKLGFTPSKLIKQIKERVHAQQEEFGNIFREKIIPELIRNNIMIVNDKSISASHKKFLDEYFENQLLAFLQPTLLDKKRIATFLQNKSIYLAVKLSVKKNKPQSETKKRSKYALVEIPSGETGRIIILPENNNRRYLILVDDVVRIFLPRIFPGYKIEGAYSIKLTRDAELYIDDEFTGNLLNKIKKGISKRKTGLPSRFLYDNEIPGEMLKFLMQSFRLKKSDLMRGGRYHNFSDLFSFPDFEMRKLEYEILPKLALNESDNSASVFSLIDNKDFLLYYPYHSYNYVIRFLEEAANDDDVKSIQITLYRVADNSRIVSALINAAKKGKRVVVFVEVKARFDEELNIKYIDILQNSGAIVLLSFPGIKVHSKICVVSKFIDGKEKFYSYLSTGNFNEKTANIYTDFGFFTADPEIGSDIVQIFTFLQSKTIPQNFKQLLVAPFNMRESFYELIENEIANAKAGLKGMITVKINNLEDTRMIKVLYKASQAGVQINLIIRGICCLIPGIKKMSENIKIISIVDRFLEHARVFIFYNNGNVKYFVGSADWMKRNLSRRIEVCFPVNDENLKLVLSEIITIQLKDNRKARIIDKDQLNNFVEPRGNEITHSQLEIHKFLSAAINNQSQIQN